MARKYDRYGRNRQFRRNPTRNPKFFPNELPFLPDFRLMVERDRPVSQYQAAKWRDIVRGARGRVQRRAEAVRDKRDRDVLSEMIGAFRPAKNARNSLIGGLSDSVMATGLIRAGQGYLKKDIAELALRTALVTGMIVI